MLWASIMHGICAVVAETSETWDVVPTTKE